MTEPLGKIAFWLPTFRSYPQPQSPNPPPYSSLPLALLASLATVGDGRVRPRRRRAGRQRRTGSPQTIGGRLDAEDEQAQLVGRARPRYRAMVGRSHVSAGDPVHARRRVYHRFLGILRRSVHGWLSVLNERSVHHRCSGLLVQWVQ